MQTQNEMVLDYVRKFGSITPLKAIRDLSITRLSARIYDLENEGYSFSRFSENAVNKFGRTVTFTRYRLRGEKDET